MTFRETHIIEDYIIQKLEEQGWNFIPADDLERESFEEPLLIPNLVRALLRINGAYSRQQTAYSKQHTVDREIIQSTPSTVYHLQPTNIGDDEINKVVNELKLTGTGIEGAKRILNFYKFGVPVRFEKEKVVRYVQVFDFENNENNEFIITRQVYHQGRDGIRTGIILYVNGIPVVNIECKNPTNISETWFNAYKQIKDYEKTVPELYKYVQIGVAAESTARYFPIVPWQEEVNTHEWKNGRGDPLGRPKQDDSPKGDSTNCPYDSIDSTIEMLSKGTLLDLIKNFLFFRVELWKATKVITRYMQYRAANKIVNRVKESMGSVESKELGSPRVGESKNKGLIWHWQGSGKTLTMIFAANKLYYLRELENPTIFFIVDRIELEDQLDNEFNALDSIKPEVIGSVWELKELLKHDDYRSKRGVFIILIHKFRPEELQDLQKEIENVGARHAVPLQKRNHNDPKEHCSLY